MNESLSTILFTPAALLDFLSSIEELSEFDIGVTEGIDGSLQVSVGDSNYSIDTSSATDVVVDPEVIDEVDELNQETYDELDAEYEDGPDNVEGGIIKEALKTLLVGGLVRMGVNALK